MDDADDELSNLVKSYKKDGYVVLPGLLDPVEIRSLGELVNTEIARGTLGPRVGATSGYYTSDASRHPGLKQIDTYLYSNPQLLRALSGVFGCDNCYRRLPRNDLMADCAGAPKWHRDRMQGSISDYVGVPQFITNSSDEALYHLVNVGFYFEDHSHDDAIRLTLPWRLIPLSSSNPKSEMSLFGTGGPFIEGDFSAMAARPGEKMSSTECCLRAPLA